MRPGASVVEVQLYGFDAHVPHLQDPLFNAKARHDGQRTMHGCLGVSAALAIVASSARGCNESTSMPWQTSLCSRAELFAAQHRTAHRGPELSGCPCSLYRVPPHRQHRHQQGPWHAVQDKDTRVLWWVLMGCDPTAWQPSPAEAAGKGSPKGWAKNRNMVLRWEALEAALRQVGRRVWRAAKCF
jgi:hypothetical protein